MLMLSELIGLAQGSGDAQSVRQKAPLRFREEADAGVSVVVWNVCRHCNMTCPHCYASADSRPSPSDLTTEEGRRLLDELAAHGTRAVVFSGGEPLLRQDVPELIAHARSLGLTPHLSSNGSLITADMARTLAQAGVDYVGVSVDGLPEFNDPYRGLPEGFAKAVAGLNHAREAGMKTGLRMTLTRANAGQLEAMLKVAREIPVNRFYLSHLVYSGRGRTLSGNDLAPEESRALLLRLFERAEALHLEGEPLRIVTGANDSAGPLLIGWIQRRYGEAAAARILRLLEERGGNSAGERLMCVDHKGDVHPDQFWRLKFLGNVRRQPWSEILAHPFRAELQGRTSRLKGRCGACTFLELCRGSHRERAQAASGDIWGSDPACVMSDTEVATALSA
ncbi:MAG: radical SAM protein [Deltaproteobacteria bacterium]|nr:radical SAM protein [Deltaproteobacteria bacterium]